MVFANAVAPLVIPIREIQARATVRQCRRGREKRMSTLELRNVSPRCTTRKKNNDLWNCSQTPLPWRSVWCVNRSTCQRSGSMHLVRVCTPLAWSQWPPNKFGTRDGKFMGDSGPFLTHRQIVAYVLIVDALCAPIVSLAVLFLAENLFEPVNRS